jgi:hypothetical protein
MHGHRFDTHFAAGTLHAQRNFATIGNQNFFKHGEWPNSVLSVAANTT